MKPQKYYAYQTDKVEGITASWAECEKIVSGVPGARFKAFINREDAEKWLEAGADYAIKHIGLEKGIYFDAGTGAGNGVEISVTDENGNSLLHKVLDKKDINKRGFHLIDEEVTNNYGELLACKKALQIALTENEKKVFGDSKLVIEYWSKGYVKKENTSAETVALAGEVKKLRWQFEKSGGQLILVSGGRNPADLGFHK